MSKLSIDKLIIEIDDLIRSCKTDEAKTHLLNIEKKPFSREQRLNVAILARRLSIPKLAARLLNPIVRPKSRTPMEATTQEKAEYAVALIYLGASYEGLKLLKSLDYKLLPEILLYEAFGYFSIWDYQQAIPVLETYIQAPSLSDYQREIGRTNLAAALVHEMDPKAVKVLEALINHTHKSGYTNLEGNAYLFLGEYHFLKHEFDAAKAALTSAIKIFSSSHSIEMLFISKWKALIELYVNNGNMESRLKLNEVRKSALEWKDWETLRDCDFFECLLLQDQNLFLKLSFGTPYQAFKNALLKDFQKKQILPTYYDWTSSDNSHSKKTLTILVDDSLKERQGNQRLLLCLASDLYKPLTIAEIHHLLYPNEYFNIVSSPVRVKKALGRLRKWLREKKIPIHIEEEASTYRIVLGFSVSLRIPQIKRLDRDLNSLMIELKTVFQNNPFSAKEASQVLKMNPWTTIELLKNAREENLAIKIGSGSKTFYLLNLEILWHKKNAA